jgi:hypothetical protein
MPTADSEGHAPYCLTLLPGQARGPGDCNCPLSAERYNPPEEPTHVPAD